MRIDGVAGAGIMCKAGGWGLVGWVPGQKGRACLSTAFRAVFRQAQGRLCAARLLLRLAGFDRLGAEVENLDVSEACSVN